MKCSIDLDKDYSYILYKLIAPNLIYINAKNQATNSQRHLKLFNETIKSFSELKLQQLLNNEYFSWIIYDYLSSGEFYQFIYKDETMKKKQEGFEELGKEFEDRLRMILQ